MTQGRKGSRRRPINKTEQMSIRHTAPAIKEPVEFDLRLPMCEKITLKNGVELYYLNKGTEETLQISWVFYAGSWNEEANLVAATTNFMLKNGTTKHNAFEINEHFEYYGAYLNRSCYSETSEITLHCLSKHVDHLLPMVEEIITDAAFPQEELDIFKQNSQQRLKVNLQKSDFVAGRLIDAQLFGEKHPYGRYSMPEDYAALEREQLVRFHNENYRHGHCVIFVAGNIPENLLKRMEDIFGALPLQPHRTHRSTIEHPIVRATQKKTFLQNDPNGVQAAIRIARPFPNRHHPDFQKAAVLNNLFGGFFGSRLMANIREDKGYTYGIYSYMMNTIRESGWIISTEAGRDVMEATIKEVYNEMQELREEPVDEEELQMTRNYMIGAILGDLDGPFQVISRWRSLVLNGLTEDYFYKGIQTIKTVTAEELYELAQRYLQPDEFYELTVV